MPPQTTPRYASRYPLLGRALSRGRLIYLSAGGHLIFEVMTGSRVTSPPNVVDRVDSTRRRLAWRCTASVTPLDTREERVLIIEQCLRGDPGGTLSWRESLTG